MCVWVFLRLAVWYRPEAAQVMTAHWEQSAWLGFKQQERPLHCNVHFALLPDWALCFCWKLTEVCERDGAIFDVRGGVVLLATCGIFVLGLLTPSWARSSQRYRQLAVQLAVLCDGDLHLTTVHGSSDWDLATVFHWWWLSVCDRERVLPLVVCAYKKRMGWKQSVMFLTRG